MSKSHISFEDAHDDIEEMLRKFRVKWQLDALAWMDYDDVCQLVRIHIFDKWHLWDQERPLRPWLSTVIGNRIKNLIRDNYTNYAKPCLRCVHFLGGDGCALLTNHVQSEACEEFAKWKKKKERAYNLKLPLPMEECIQINSEAEEHVNFDKSEIRLHEEVLKRLPEKQQIIYRMLYMEGKTNSEVARRFGFKADMDNRKTARYKHINNLRKKFYELAKQVVREGDIL